MCGIAGYYCRKGIDQNVLDNMNKLLLHRGPDDNDTWRDDCFGLAHTRLSILDLSKNGRQPMESSSGRYIIIFNGEIYNHLDLRKFLHAKWRGHSDTETILESIESYGIEKTLTDIEGMFSFVLFDKINKTLTLARDPIGQKPLYYGWLKDNFIFASELKAFKAINNLDLTINRKSLSVFIKTGYIPAPNSIYDNIFKLKPGHFATIKPSESKNLIIKKYYDLKKIISARSIDSHIGDSIEQKSKLKKVLVDSIKRQQISDVPIGSFLSGGIDSSLISCLMQEISSSKIDTFTIGFEDQRFDESGYAKSIASIIGSKHNELIINHQDVQDVIPLVPQIYDEPFSDSSQLVTYLLSKFAISDVKVTLSGDGGDELFGGYNRYIWASRILSVPYSIRKKVSYLLNLFSYNMISKFEDLNVKTGFIKSNFQFSDKMNKLSYLINKKDFFDLYQNLLFNYIDNLEDDVVLQSIKEVDTISCHEIPNNLNDINEKMMYYDSLIYLPDDILCKVDRASMSVGLETRIPFLDKEVIEFAWKLPVSQKIYKGKTKNILRNLLEEYIPNKLIERPKMGFSVPLASWLRGPLKDYANEKINSAINHKDQYFDSKKVAKKWDEHKSGERNWHYFIWNVIVFQSWLEYNS